MVSKWKITEEGRECTKCGKFKKWDEFGKAFKEKTGHSSRCLLCLREYARDKARAKGTKPNKTYLITKEGRECIGCDVFKGWRQFARNKSSTNGHTSTCKSCTKEYRENNKDKLDKQKKEWYENNRDKVKERMKKYQKDKAKYFKERKKEYYTINKRKMGASRKNWRENNKEKAKESDKKYRASHREQRRTRYHVDPEFKLKTIIRAGLRRAIKLAKADFKESKTLASKAYLGCSIQEFRTHLENQFDERMNWGNHSIYGWHVDHKKPLAAFTFTDEEGNTDEEELKKACHYTNLQPLWWDENLSKGDYWEDE